MSAALHNNTTYERILQDMSEGVVILGLDGIVQFSNHAAADILGLDPESLVGHSMASLFFQFKENDRFTQTVVNLVLHPEQTNVDLVPFYTGEVYRQLNVMSSFLREDGEKCGIIMMISDITELSALKIRYTEQISALLNSLVKALSVAIDERSNYTANHTRNMVCLGSAFLGWLDKTGSPLRFEEKRKRAFLMSVWLHDVGKLTIPVEIMDKATRLGDHMEDIRQRMEKQHLLDRIAFLEGRIDQAQWTAREEQRKVWMDHILRINSAGFLGEEELSFVDALEGQYYLEEDGSRRPVFTEEERHCLRIRKGTLTDQEREVMQSHVIMTRKILENVHFPDDFAMVPEWAASHHELLNGTGYPEHKQGKDIPLEVRLLTILDIFEALTARDRPYKKPISLERSLRILDSMVAEGAIDGELLALFKESRAWELQEVSRGGNEGS